MDPTTFASGLGVARALIAVFKDLNELAKKKDMSAITERLMAAQGISLEMMEKYSDLFGELQGAKALIARLKEEAQTKSALEVHYSAYWTRTENGKLDGPFLSKAWDIERQLVRMPYWGTSSDLGEAKFIDIQNKSEVMVPLKFIQTQCMDHLIRQAGC